MEDYTFISDRPDIGLGNRGNTAEVFSGPEIDLALDAPTTAVVVSYPGWIFPADRPDIAGVNAVDRGPDR